MRALLAGKHELGCQIWKFLNSQAHVICGVITCRTEKKDSARLSLKKEIEKANVKPLNKADSYSNFFDAVKNFNPDVFISAGFDWIIKRDLLDLMSKSVNIHFGMLPKYRGMYSIPWAIMNDEKMIGVSLHEISEGIDDGPIIDQKIIVNDPKKSCKDFFQYKEHVHTKP